MKKKSYINKKTMFVTLTSLVAVSVPIVFSTSLSTAGFESKKILFQGKIFNNYNEALNYFLSSNNSIKKELVYGDVEKATMNLSTGELNKDSLAKYGSGESVAYQTAFGRHRRNFEEAQKTYVNPVFMKNKYTFGNGEKIFDTREEAKKSREALSKTQKVFYYKIRNNLKDTTDVTFPGDSNNTKNERINNFYHQEEFVFNPFNSNQIQDLKDYLLEENNRRKMKNSFIERWKEDLNSSKGTNQGFNLGIYVENKDGSSMKEFTPSMDKFGEVRKKWENAYREQRFTSQEKTISKLQWFLTLKNEFRSIIFHGVPLKIKNINNNILTTIQDVHVGTKAKMVNLPIDLKQDKNQVKFEKNTITMGTSKEEISVPFKIGIKNKWKESEITINSSKHPFKLLFEEDSKHSIFLKLLEKKYSVKKTTRVFLSGYKGNWSYDDHGFVRDHYYKLQELKFIYTHEEHLEDHSSKNNDFKIMKNLNRLNFLFGENQTNIKQVIKYNNIPLFEIVKKPNTPMELKNISLDEKYNSRVRTIKFSGKQLDTDLKNKIGFNSAYSYVKSILEKLQKLKEIDCIYMGEGENKGNNSQLPANKSLKTQFFWGKRWTYTENILTISQILLPKSTLNINFGNSVYGLPQEVYQLPQIMKTTSELAEQKNKERPPVSNLWVIYSIDGSIINITKNKLLNDNSIFDNKKLILKNSRNKIHPTIDSNYIYVKKQGEWKLFENQVHSIYHVKNLVDKYFNSYTNLNKYLLEYIKMNSKLI